jgi:hypothetical protein
LLGIIFGLTLSHLRGAEMPELYPDDQEKVNKYLSSNVNDVERKPFRPLILLVVVVLSLTALTYLGVFLSVDHGVM